MGSRAEKKKVRREKGKEERQQERKKTSEKKEEIKGEGGKFMVFKVSAFDYWSMTYKTLHCISLLLPLLLIPLSPNPHFLCSPSHF
jgi:hypothetical protein